MRLINDVNSQVQSSSETNKWKIAKAINSIDNEQRRREEVAIINLIANFGYIKDSDVHVPFITPYEDLQDYTCFDNFPHTAPDWIYLLTYYNSLNLNPITPRSMITRFQQRDKKLSKTVANFVRDMTHRNRAFAEVTEGCYSPIDKKVVSSIVHGSGINQKRVMVLPPVNDWIPRISILANGSVSSEISNQLLESYGLKEIVRFFEDRLEEPSKEECNELFLTLFPNEKMGEYDVISDSETNIDVFNQEVEDEVDENKFLEEDSNV